MWDVTNPFSLKLHGFMSFLPVLDLLSAGMCHHTPEGAERREVADELCSLLHLLGCSCQSLALIFGVRDLGGSSQMKQSVMPKQSHPGPNKLHLEPLDHG